MKQLQIKELMLVGAFGALYFLCVGLGTLLSLLFDRSGSMMYAPACAALLAGPVYMLLLAKVRKFGAITLVGVLMAAFFFLSGYMTMAFLPSLLFGLLADVVANMGRYQSKLGNLLSYVCFSFGNLGPIILMWVVREAYIDNLMARGKSMEYIERVMVAFNWNTVLWLACTIVCAAVISGLFGHYMLQRYFKTSGFVA